MIDDDGGIVIAHLHKVSQRLTALFITPILITHRANQTPTQTTNSALTGTHLLLGGEKQL